MDKKAILEAVKEPLRLLVLAVVPFVLVYLEVFDAQWAVGLTALLRFVDKLLHELGKSSKNKLLAKGLTRF